MDKSEAYQKIDSIGKAIIRELEKGEDVTIITNRYVEEPITITAGGKGFNNVKFTSDAPAMNLPYHPPKSEIKSNSNHYDHCRIEIYHQHHCVIAKDDEGDDRLVDYFLLGVDAHNRAIDYDIRYRYNGN